MAVNPNDAERYPTDSFDAMKQRVAQDGGWPHPYLRDESQEVARAYGAKTTPDVFFMIDGDRRLRTARRARTPTTATSRSRPPRCREGDASSTARRWCAHRD